MAETLTDTIDAVVTTQVNTKFSEYQKALQAQFDEFTSALKTQFTAELSGVFNSVLGDSGLGGALGAGLSNALASALSGNGVNARSVADAAATALVPTVQSFFNASASQSGEDLISMITAAQRNF